MTNNQPKRQMFNRKDKRSIERNKTGKYGKQCVKGQRG